MAYSKLNPGEEHNRAYLENLENFKNTVQREVIDNNVMIYLKKLIRAKKAIELLINLGYFKWNLKFGGILYFFGLKIRLFKRDDPFSCIDKCLDPKVDIELKKIEESFLK